MKKAIAVAAVVLAVTVAGSVETVKADHCSSSFGRSSSYSFGFQPSYSSYSSYPRHSNYSNGGYGYSNGYNSFGTPSYGGFGYSRPGFSISIGGGRSSFGFGSFGHSHGRRHSRSLFGSHRH